LVSGDQIGVENEIIHIPEYLLEIISTEKEGVHKHIYFTWPM